jgi:hypothetical protein
LPAICRDAERRKFFGKQAPAEFYSPA